MSRERDSGEAVGGRQSAAAWSTKAVDRWPDERAVLKAIKSRGGTKPSMYRTLMPYAVARYRVISKEGLVREGLTAINAALDPYPEELSQALVLFRPKLVKMRRTPAEFNEASVIPPSGRDVRLLIEKVTWWLSELNEEIEELADKLKAASREAKRSLILPGSPSLARADRELRDYLGGMKAKREAFNLLFGLPWGEEVERVEVERVEGLFQRVWVILTPGGPPLVVEAEGKRGARLDEGLSRFLASSEAAARHLLLALLDLSS